jgi:threonine dehydrogenase-like Zn-dependent dehydrogenase
MRAAFYEGAGAFRTGDAPQPSPVGDETLLRVRRVGICGTDLHIFQGHLDHRVPKGGVIGHETFAEVAEAGPGSGFHSGDRVVVEPLSVCGTCRACRMGADYICYGLKVLSVDLPGGMREYWAAPTARLIRVPDALGDDQAAMMEPLAIAVHDVRRAAVKTDDTVLVLGGGPIGALIALVCRARGARVAVAEVNPFPPVPVNLYQMFARELTLHGSRLYTRGDWEEAIRLAATKTIDVSPLVSRVIPLDGLADGMREALAGGPVMKILVDVTR